MAEEADKGRKGGDSEDDNGAALPGSEMEDFLAAGILPFARSQGGAVKFFLGKELTKGAGRNKYVWSDFGGKREGHNESGDTLCLLPTHMPGPARAAASCLFVSLCWFADGVAPGAAG